MEALQQALVDAALALVVDHHVPEKTVTSWIRDALANKAKDLPTIPVAYCNGQYRTSEHFAQFRRDIVQKGCTPAQVVTAFLGRPLQDGDPAKLHVKRIADALAIPEYGQHVRMTYPEIASTFAAYRKGSVFYAIAEKFYEFKKKMECAQRNVDDIRKALDQPPDHNRLFAATGSKGKDASKLNYDVLTSYMSLRDYARGDVETFMATIDEDELMLKAANAARLYESHVAVWNGYPKALCISALQFVNDVKNGNMRAEDCCYGLFMDTAVADYPGNLEKAWNRQSNGFRFLERLRKADPEAFALFGTSADAQRDDDAALGEFCASVSVKHMAQHVHFTIRQSSYDAREWIES